MSNITVNAAEVNTYYANVLTTQIRTYAQSINCPCSNGLIEIDGKWSLAALTFTGVLVFAFKLEGSEDAVEAAVQTIREALKA